MEYALDIKIRRGLLLIQQLFQYIALQDFIALFGAQVANFVADACGKFVTVFGFYLIDHVARYAATIATTSAAMTG